ncbi:Uncharacterised protein [uncultured archaeon]|nr:Uncharacterised protein [uncultured archaeon]
MHGKCAECGKEGEMSISSGCQYFCNAEHQKLYTYKPNMTEETYAESTTIDEIDIDNRTTMYLETTEGFYAIYSGYKVVITLHRGISKPKQVGSYYTLVDAKADWEKYKKKHNIKSWADKNARQIVAREIY